MKRLLLISLALLAACGGTRYATSPANPAPPPPPPPGQPAAATVTITDAGFGPASVTINVGQSVTWTNTGSTAHSVTFNNQTFDTGRIEPGRSFTRTFIEAGPYAYHDGLHKELSGIVVVNP
jgi:plastocyanin